MKYIKYFLASVISFIAPIKGMIIIVSLVVIIDTVFAIYCAVKKEGWKSFTSTKLFNIVVKTFFYMTTILLSYMVSVYIFDGKTYGVDYLIPKIVTLFWVVIEVKSIDETSVKLGNRPALEIIKSIIMKAKGFKKDLNELK